MAFKTFFQIKEANAEIARLSTELSTSQTALTEAQTALSTAQSEHKAALEKKDSDHKTAIDAKDAKIKELEGNVTEITGERDTARTEVATKDARIAEIERKATNVETRAADIAASVGGTKPIAAGNSEKDANDPYVRMQEAWSKPFIKR